MMLPIFRLLSAALLLPLSAATYSTNGDSPTVYQALQSYGFPVGLLPEGVTSYELDSGTGKFVVRLNNTCSFSIQGYDLKYKTKITGTVSKKKIKDLKGIQVKVLLFWVNIVEVTIKSGDELEFSVGIASAEFAAGNFEESPQCGCGFDCGKNERSGGGGFSFKRLVISPRLEILRVLNLR